MSTTFQTFHYIDQCFVATTQLQQFSKIISLSSDQDRILIFEGEKSIGKSITVKAYSQASKNTLYFSVKFEDPEGIFEEVLYQLGDLNFLDLNIPLLKVFGPKKKNVPHLEYYLSSFPDIRIENNKPTIIIDNFDFLYNANSKMALKLLAAARLVSEKYQFLFVATEGYLLRSELAHETRILFQEFPQTNEFERMEFAKCYLRRAFSSDLFTHSNVSQYLTASFAINRAFMNAMCLYNMTINSDEDVKLLLKGKSDLQLLLQMNFEDAKLDFFTEDKKEIVLIIKKPILETIFALIDYNEIDFKKTILPEEIVKKYVFKIEKQNFGDKRVVFQTKFHKIISEIKFGKKNSSQRKDLRKF